MNIEAVIFDLDGVIVTTDDYHYEAWKKIADQENIYFDREINERLRGVSRMESLDIILEKSSKIYNEEEKIELATRKNDYYKNLLENLTKEDILPGILETLNFLENKKIKTAIGSSSKNTIFILNKIGLIDKFDAIVDGTMIKNSKPAPEVFLQAAEKVGIKAEKCLVVEDADAGVEAGKRAGMRVLGVGSAKNNENADYKSENMEEFNIASIFLKR
ncbi:MAG: beta-phosphoglucomutase [Fusobacteriaceae bacterium]|nr:beta-phosphoglucomutase [Fusobacteriaceae bacterium]MBP6467403.1 beta-phosphoglucomutase [Fusobacteriaceae bacterium]MBU9917345.1 beta-phosphoglucomutase [Fusobacteriaceae bacterium]